MPRRSRHEERSRLPSPVLTGQVRGSAHSHSQRPEALPCRRTPLYPLGARAAKPRKTRRSPDRARTVRGALGRRPRRRPGRSSPRPPW
ncbi:hypothetical protein FM112_01880 [Gulosibacter sp. 10]|nr:hypothetical protein FM112_01880 [Gulosibacter sp. 10]